MNQQELQPYLSILTREPFALYPTPEGMDEADNRFKYLHYNATHLTIESLSAGAGYVLPLVLIEFANPRVLRLIRTVRPYNGSFV